MDNNAWYLGEVVDYNENRGFGFIHGYVGKTQYFFHVSKLKSRPVGKKMKVVFQLNPSRKEKTFECINVTSVTNFTWSEELLVALIGKLNIIQIKKEIIGQLTCQNVNLLVEYDLNLLNESNDNYNNFAKRIEYIKNTYDSFVENEALTSFISQKTDQFATESTKFNLWINGIIEKQPKLDIITEYFTKNKGANNRLVYSKISEDDKEIFARQFFCRTDFMHSLKSLIFFLNIEAVQEYQQRFIETFTENFLSQKKANIDISDLLSDVCSCVARLDADSQVILVSFLHEVSDSISGVRMWLCGLIEILDLDEYSRLMPQLNSQEQQLLFKKVVSEGFSKGRKKARESVFQLMHLAHQTAETENRLIDFSTHVVMEVLRNFHNHTFLGEEELFRIIAFHAQKDPRRLVSLEGFFEECNGRKLPNKIVEDQEGSKSISSLKTVSIPRGVSYCEGVRFGEDGKDRKYHHDCWWCRGGQCFNANQRVTIPKNHEAFTLADILNMLNYSFDFNSYWNFLGLLNKINEYLKHLVCRNCEHVLMPVDDKKFSNAYRVTRFRCYNGACGSENIVVYLTHCLGSRKAPNKQRCYNLIDSRDTKRCNYRKHSPTNVYQEYGPFVCNVCGSCCSQASLVRIYDNLITRKWSMQPELLWKIEHNVGHLERGELFCYSCGEEMMGGAEEYNRFIERLQQPDESFKILRNGENDYGFWYMINADEAFFEDARRVGLRVSATQGTESNVQFVAKGNSHVQVCPKCDMKYNKLKAEFAPTVEEL